MEVAKKDGSLTQVLAEDAATLVYLAGAERHHTAHLAVARRRAAPAGPPDPRLRPLPRRRLRRGARGGARGGRRACATPGWSRSRWSPARAGSTSSARCAAARPSATVHALRARAGGGDGRRRPPPPDAAVAQGRPRRAHLRRRQPHQLRPARGRAVRGPRPASARRWRCRSTGTSSSDARLKPDRWTIRTAAARVASEGDAWKGLARRARELPAAAAPTRPR